MTKYPFQAEINGQTRYIETYGDTEEQAKEEALWKLKRAAGVPITEIKNLRMESIADESTAYGTDCPNGKCE